MVYVKGSILFFCMIPSFLNTIVEEMILSSFLASLMRILTQYVCSYFWTLYLAPWISVSVFMPVAHSFNKTVFFLLFCLALFRSSSLSFSLPLFIIFSFIHIVLMVPTFVLKIRTTIVSVNKHKAKQQLFRNR